jgi:hypothetical protein
MIANVLATWIPQGLDWLFIILICFISYGVPIFLVIFFIRQSLRNKKENIRLRLEVGKLADELEKVRKQKQDTSG